VNQNQRHKRLRLLIKKLNQERKRQAKKIDIICNDLIAAHRNFIRTLNTITFAADFYKSIMGTTDLGRLLHTASKLIKNEIGDVNVCFFLRQSDNFELHIFESDKPITFAKQRLENHFTTELVEDICKSNKLCTLEDMFAMGLQGNLTDLNMVSAVTIPLAGLGLPLGFMLIYRSSEDELKGDELNRIAPVASGLSRAIQACQLISRSAE
jgi:transcriptional regulator with GAF, ATPase, and Fis domain